MVGALFNPATLDTNPYDKTQYNMGEAVQSGLKSADLQIEREGKERATAALPRYIDTVQQAKMSEQEKADVVRYLPDVVKLHQEYQKQNADVAKKKTEDLNNHIASLAVSLAAANNSQGPDAAMNLFNDSVKYMRDVMHFDTSNLEKITDYPTAMSILRLGMGSTPADAAKTGIKVDTTSQPGLAITTGPFGNVVDTKTMPKQPEDKGELVLNPDGTPKVISQTKNGVTLLYNQRKMHDGKIVPEKAAERNVTQAKQQEPHHTTYNGVPGTVINGKFVALKDPKTGEDLTPPGGEKPVGGAKGSLYTEQIRTSASEALAEFENVSELMQSNNLPIRSSFQDAQDAGGTTLKAFKNYLAQKATPEESNIYVAAAAGLDLALSRVQNAGQPAQQAQIKQMREALKFTNADDRYSMLYKMNNAKQRVIKALEGWQLGTQSQRDEIKAIADMIRNDPSYIAPSDMTRIARGEAPKHMNDAKPQGALAPAAAKLPPKNVQGWILHTDKNGNRAYVSPDGKQYQEVK